MDAPFDTTCDAFLDGRIHVRQPAKGFRSGLDAVFLAAACPAEAAMPCLKRAAARAWRRFACSRVSKTSPSPA